MSGDNLSVVKERWARILSLVLDRSVISAVEMGVLWANIKLQERESGKRNPEQPFLGLRKEIKESRWIIEERNNDFYCGCEDGFKVQLCKHILIH